MDVVNLGALFELLEDAGLTRKRDRSRLMLLAQLSSAFSGKSRDRLQCPAVPAGTQLYRPVRRRPCPALALAALGLLGRSRPKFGASTS